MPHLSYSSNGHAAMIILRGILLGILWSILLGECESSETFAEVGDRLMLWVEEKKTFDVAESYCNVRGAKLIEFWNDQEWDEASVQTNYGVINYLNLDLRP